LPAELPRIEHRHEPSSCTCAQCGRDLVKIGEDVSEQLDVEPARFFVHRHIRPQYACRACETVSAAAVPPALIDGGLAAPGLHAWVLIQKYLDHLPLYRIEQISARQGVPIARSTLAQWVGQLGVSLQPLSDRLVALLKAGTVLHADETPVQQLDPGQGKTKRAYLWAYRSNALQGAPPIVVFDYQSSRSGAHARDFLQGWRGHLMVDDYSGYKALFGAQVTELACLAHCRRKFFDLHAAGGHPVAAEALRRLGELYAVEEQARAGTIAARLALRQREAAPRLSALHDYLSTQRLRTANGSGLARAIDYSLKRWPALQRYLADGALPIGRVEVWRGDVRFGLSVADPFGCRCLSIQTIVPFPHPARRTRRADFPQRALFQRIKPSHANGRQAAAQGVSVPRSHRGTGRSIGGTPFPFCPACASTRSADAARRSRRSGGTSDRPGLG
jgi:transposase